jgi:hypothetical protein
VLISGETAVFQSVTVFVGSLLVPLDPFFTVLVSSESDWDNSDEDEEEREEMDSNDVLPARLCAFFAL